MKVIKRLKKTVLLEQENGYRFHVATDTYNKEEVTDEEILEGAIPHSLSFDLIFKEMLDFEAIQTELYKAGIHTYDDILNNRKRANDILRGHFSADALIRRSKS